LFDDQNGPLTNLSSTPICSENFGVLDCLGEEHTHTSTSMCSCAIDGGTPSTDFLLQCEEPISVSLTEGIQRVENMEVRANGVPAVGPLSPSGRGGKRGAGGPEMEMETFRPPCVVTTSSNSSPGSMVAILMGLAVKATVSVSLDAIQECSGGGGQGGQWDVPILSRLIRTLLARSRIAVSFVGAAMPTSINTRQRISLVVTFPSVIT